MVEDENRSDGKLFSVQIRPYELADRESVLALADRLAVGIAPWRSGEGMRGAAQRWTMASIDGIGPRRCVLVAEASDGAVVGFVSVARETNFTGEPQAYIGELAVAGQAEGQGVGSALIAASEAWAQDLDLELVVLETGAANARARQFYAKLGYAEESVKLAKVLKGKRNRE